MTSSWCHNGLRTCYVISNKHNEIVVLCCYIHVLSVLCYSKYMYHEHQELSLLVAKKVVVMTTNSVTSYDNVGILTTLGFEWCRKSISWWRHQMETFSALMAICAGNSPVTGEFPAQRPVTRSFEVFFDLRLNKPLSKQWWGWWFETLSRPLCCHGNGNPGVHVGIDGRG